MVMIKILLLLMFGLPIVALSLLFMVQARRMMREEAEREAIRKAAAQAAQHDVRRRRARYIAAGARTGVCR